MIWSSIRQTAIVGTDRRPFVLPPETPPEVAALLAPDAATEAGGAPERQVLQAAAAWTLYRRAGYVPAATEATPVALAPKDTRRSCGLAATELLLQFAAGNQADLLALWCDQARGHRRVAPAQTLPSLLDLAARQTAWRKVFVPLLGERGRWLAGLNPAWRWVAETAAEAASVAGADPAIWETGTQADPAIWETGTQAERVAWLLELRKRDPAAAREALAAVWKTESAAARSAFLEVLQTGLGADDEAFLEAALDDRAKGVRGLAAEMLVALPGSALQQRMQARLATLLSLAPGTGKGGAPLLRIALPAECTSDMSRDGLDATPPPKGVGERTWWLCALVARTDPAFWERHLALSAEEIVGLRIEEDTKDELHRLLLNAWSSATQALANNTWAQALVGLCVASRHLSEQVFNLQRLGALLSPEQIERLLEIPVAQGQNPPHWLLLCHTRPWSEALSRQVLREMAERLHTLQGPHAGSGFADLFCLSLLALPMTAARDLAAVLSMGDPPPEWRQECFDVATACLNRRQRLSGVLSPEDLPGALLLADAAVGGFYDRLRNLEQRLSVLEAFQQRDT